jgi:hypothetical protein
LKRASAEDIQLPVESAFLNTAFSGMRTLLIIAGYAMLALIFVPQPCSSAGTYT